MDLYYLIYTSIPAKPMDDMELQELLHISREANGRFQVTGMLIYLPESFIQLIEGPKAHIKRHLRVTTLRAGSMEHRFFPDWAMALKKQDIGETHAEILSLHDEKVLKLFDILDDSCPQ
jgi:hypothetical protein